MYEAVAEWQQWIDNFSFHEAPLNTFDLPVIGCTTYLVIITLVKMNVKGTYQLKLLAKVHNLLLCLLSFLMLAATTYHVIKIAMQRSVFDIFCDALDHPLGSINRGPLMFWCYIFYVSKYYEMLDTVLLVLKGRPLAFIHVYHHSIVPFLFWAMLATDCTAHWVLVINNSGVHVVMYFYYLVRTLGYNPWWKELVTIVQIIQFFIDMMATWPHIFSMFILSPTVTGWRCHGSMITVVFGQLVGLSFVYLFTSFYFTTYKKQKKE